MQGRCLLVVPLTGLATAVPRAAVEGTDCHVTLLDPFTPEPHAGTLTELATLFADVVPFLVRLTGVSQFPGGSAYLTPEPALPFRQLAHELLRLFPEAPRPSASFDLVPHVDVPLRPGESLEDLQAELEPWLPATTMAQEAALWRADDRGVRTLARFAFGTSAA